MKLDLHGTSKEHSRWLCCLVLLLLSVLSLSLDAAEVEGLYQASIPVASRDNERERQQAFTSAMLRVLVKLTGRQDTLEHPGITRALSNPQPFVEAWAHRSLVNPEANTAQGTGKESIVLEVKFFQSEIQNLLNAANIPIWPRNRPETLLWLVIQDETGQRSLAQTPGGDLEVSKLLSSIASERGLPLISPIMDIADQRAIRADHVWNFDRAAIEKASARYQVNSILSVRLQRVFGGQVIAKALYQFRDIAIEIETYESETQAFLNSSIDMVTQELAANYAILLSGVDANSSVYLTVDNVNGVADYAGVLRYLETLAVVQAVQINSVNASTLELELNTGGQLRQLIESIALDNKLLPLQEPLRDKQQVKLSYQWRNN